MPVSQIEIVLNGQTSEIRAEMTIAELLESLEIKSNAIAVELNTEIQTRAEFENVVLDDGDTIEIVSLVGGG